MWQDPQPLVEGAIIDCFTPDPNLSWLVAYAGPCGDEECTKPHLALYLLPMIGWFQVIVPTNNDTDEMGLRPVIMGSNGIPVDYLDIPDHYKFVAVLRNQENAFEVAHAIYVDRFGADGLQLEKSAIQQVISN